MQQRDDTDASGNPAYLEIYSSSKSGKKVQSDYNSKPIPKSKEGFEEWILGYYPSGHNASELKEWKNL